MKNERSHVLSKKYNVGLLRKCFDPLNPPNVEPDQTTASQNEPEPERPLSDDELDRQTPDVEERSENDSYESDDPRDEVKSNHWNKLPDELVEMILLQASINITSFNHLSLTCHRFKETLDRKKNQVLPELNLTFTDKEQKQLNKYNGKIKISTRKLLKYFGGHSGVAKQVSLMVNNKKWRSAWLLLEHKRHSTYLVRKVYWKKGNKDELPTESPDIIEESHFWIRNEQYFLKTADQKILQSRDTWLNDRIMDAAQKLICKTLGEEDNYQSVLNTQKNTAIPFQPVYQDHIQLLHDGGSHWFLSFCSSGRVQICDSLKSSLNRCSKKSLYSLYKHVVGEYERVNPTFLTVQKQPDGFNCGVFAIAFAAEILDGCSPMDAVFDVGQMRRNLMTCLQQETLTPFPKVAN